MNYIHRSSKSMSLFLVIKHSTMQKWRSGWEVKVRELIIWWDLISSPSRHTGFFNSRPGQGHVDCWHQVTLVDGVFGNVKAPLLIFQSSVLKLISERVFFFSLCGLGQEGQHWQEKTKQKKHSHSVGVMIRSWSVGRGRTASAPTHRWRWVREDRNAAGETRTYFKEKRRHPWGPTALPTIITTDV